MRHFQATAFDHADRATHSPGPTPDESRQSVLTGILSALLNLFRARSEDEPQHDDEAADFEDAKSERGLILGAMREALITTGNLPEALERALVSNHRRDDIDLLDDLGSKADERFESLLNGLAERVIPPEEPEEPLIFTSSFAS